MENTKKFVVAFNEVGKEDIPLVGGKGANLGEMIRIGIPVPNGFIVTAEAYYDFLNSTTLRNLIEKELKDLDVSKTKQLDRKAAKIQKAILNSKMPRAIRSEIIDSYSRLSGFTKVLVAVRSSATAEDLPDASFAGQQSTYLNIKNEANVVQAVQMCWASLFEPRAIFYRATKGFDHLKVGIAVPVQKMVQSETAGIMFTINPINNDDRLISIEAVLGLGETIVSGAITPDQYLVNKRSLGILEKHIATQDWMLIRRGRGVSAEKSNIKVKISPAWQKKQKLADKYIVTLAKIGKVLEKHYGVPQDIEWAVEGGKVWIVQARPVTTLKIDDSWKETPTLAGLKAKIETEATKASKSVSSEKESKSKPVSKHAGIDMEMVRKELRKLDLLLKGSAASPGIVSAKVRVVKDEAEMHKVKEGDILVTVMTTPSWVPVMKKAAAIVTDQGGATCHAAIVSRELGIPCVVGTQIATKILKNNEFITVDGEQGLVYEGELRIEMVGDDGKKEMSKTAFVEDKKSELDNYVPVKTATKIYVNLAEPERAEEIASRDVDGIGLLRAEFMISELKLHPRYALEKGKKLEYIAKLRDSMEVFCKAFGERPVIYRANDFKTNEYKGLTGGAKYEKDEANPMIGFRGAMRYIKDPEVFEMELEAIKELRNKKGYKNLWLMVPFVRTVEELREIKHIINNSGLKRSPSFKLFMMVEIPSNVILIDKFIELGIDGVSIGTNDLTQLTLGVDRDNPVVQDVFDERNEAVLWSLERVVRACHKAKIACSVCGQAPSVYPEITRALVEYGVTSISVNPDMIEKTRTLVAGLEKDLIKKKR